MKEEMVAKLKQGNKAGFNPETSLHVPVDNMPMNVQSEGPPFLCLN